MTREDLYEKVWSLPASKLQESLGISDVAIAKLCKRMNVPKPPRGYWARLENGQKLPRPPLPVMSKEALAALKSQSPLWTGSRPAPVPKRPHEIPPEAFKFPADFRSTHPLIRRTRELLQVAKAKKERFRADLYPRVQPGEACILDVSVGKESIDRALLVMQALINGLETKGCSIVVEEDKQTWKRRGRWITQIKGFERSVRFHLEEPSSQIEHVPTPDEAKFGHFNKWDFVPSGKLRLMIDEYAGNGLRKQWLVRDDKSLGKTLASFVDGVMEFSKAMVAAEAERERYQREWAESERRRREAETRLHQLQTAASAWEQAEKMRRFLKAFEAQVGAVQPGSALAKWLAWAKQYASSIDPMQRLIAEIEQKGSSE